MKRTTTFKLFLSYRSIGLAYIADGVSMLVLGRVSDFSFKAARDHTRREAKLLNEQGE